MLTYPSACIGPDGEDVTITLEAEEAGHDEHEEGSSATGQKCHFHAGVE